MNVRALLAPVSLVFGCTLAACSSDDSSTGPPEVASAAGSGQDRPTESREVLPPLEAEIRAITPRGSAFVADRGWWQATFDDQGATLERNGARIGVRLSAWGREGALEAVERVRPVLGACTQGVRGNGGCIPRLEYASSGLTAWWVSRSDGLEQGFNVEKRPEGSGALVLSLATDGATAEVEANGQVARLYNDDGGFFTISSALAWDAEGKPLATTLLADASGLRLLVDDSVAVWPVTVDPVYDTASTSMTGSAESGFGGAVASAGDVNGDGFADAVVGAFAANSSVGEAFVYLGTVDGIDSTAASTIEGTTANGAFGDSVASAGDINADGYDDVVIGAPGAHVYGTAFLFYGSGHGIGDSASLSITGPSDSSYFGAWVASAGDVNGDGFADVVVGAPFSQSNQGSIYLYEGAADGLSTTPATEIAGADPYAAYGTAAASAGDTNGDGFDDVIVGAPRTEFAFGAIYLYEGSSDGLLWTESLMIIGPAKNSFFGAGVASAGDVDGDGFDDVIVGALGTDSEAGAAYVYAGSSDGLSPTAATTLTEPTGTGGEFGCSVASAGDTNGDGFDDVVVGALTGASDFGEVGLFQGSAAGLSTTAATVLEGPSHDSHFGFSVAGLGDANADGYDDVIVGAYHTTYGGVFVYLGYNEDADGDGFLVGVDCDDNDPKVGATTYYADADGDGYGDDGATVVACDAPKGTVAEGGDCDDANASVYPGAGETCDGVDEDCDGVVDNGACGTDVSDDPGGANDCGCSGVGRPTRAHGWLLLAVGLLAARRRRT